MCVHPPAVTGGSLGRSVAVGQAAVRGSVGWSASSAGTEVDSSETPED